MGQIDGASMRCNLPYVKGYADRHGKMRYYFRRKGCRPVVLNGVPGTPEFLAAYQTAMEAPKAAPTPLGVIAGSFDALCRDYLSSAEFSQLATTTRREMNYVIETLRKEHADKPVNRLARRHIMDWKDRLKEKPGAANKMLRTLKTLLGYAVLKEYREDNPAEKVKLMKHGRFRSWCDEELAQYEAVWPIGSLERMIYDLALYTGQRRSDLPTLKRTQVYGPNLKMTQQKTGKDMVIRIHTNLAKSIAAFLPTHSADTIIAGPAGTSLSSVYMAAIFRAATRKAGLPADCVLHGLRKTTARILAELGMKSAPITGHQTRAMQDEYERDANQQMMGSAAILSWEKAGRKKQA